MTDTDVPSTTHATESSSAAYDAVVVGGGASGLAAAVFLARYGFDVVVFDRGSSAIRRCELVENYLGFVGIDPSDLLALGRGHVRVESGEVVDDRVTAVELGAHETERDGPITVDEEPASDGDGRRFRVATQDGDVVSARYVVAASVYDGDYLAGLAGLAYEAGDHPVPCEDEPGRTAVDGLYVAGWLSGGPHQVLAAAGHGTRVAKALLADHRVAVEGFWPGAASHWDWRVDAERYGGAEWRAEVEAWLESTRPDDGSVDDDRFERVLDAVLAERLAMRRTAAELERRRERSRALLGTVLLDGDEERTREEADSGRTGAAASGGDDGGR